MVNRVAQSIMDSLDPISAWAQSVNWAAWGSLGSVGAIAAAVWVSGRASREARERDLAKIEAISVIATGLQVIFAGRAARGVGVDPTDTDVLNSFEQLRLLVEGIAIIDLPTRVTADAYMVIATRVQITDAIMKAVAAGKADRSIVPEQCEIGSEAMSTQIGRLAGETFRLKHPLRLAAARATIRLMHGKDALRRDV